MPIISIDGEPVGDGKLGAVSARGCASSSALRLRGRRAGRDAAATPAAARGPVRLGQHAGRQLAGDHRGAQRRLHRMGLPQWSLAESQARCAARCAKLSAHVRRALARGARHLLRRASARIHLDRLAPMPGAEALLARAVGAGVLLASSATRPGICAPRRRISAGPLFRPPGRRRRRAARQAGAATDRSGARRQRLAGGADVWFVGDTAVDMECAAARAAYPFWSAGRSETTAGARERHPPASRARNCHDAGGHCFGATTANL